MSIFVTKTLIFMLGLLLGSVGGITFLCLLKINEPGPSIEPGREPKPYKRVFYEPTD